MDPIILQQIGIALGLGMLVGFQRELGDPHVAGIRQFAMVTVLGVLCARLDGDGGGWITAAGLLGVTAMILVAALLKVRSGEIEPGLTTEIAGLVMYAVGATLVAGHTGAAVMVGGAIAVLLHWKDKLLGVIRRFAAKDVKAIMQLVLIALVILPVLPDKTYGPYQVINPRGIWWMVVLIVGISLGGFFAYKFFGAKAGTLLGGVLGGLISSTATTVSYARRSKSSPDSSPLATLVIMLASTIVFFRVAAEVAVVAPEVLWKVAAPLGAMAAVMVATSAALFFQGRGERVEVPVDDDPSELKAAIAFGLLYAGVLFAVAAAKEHLGDGGLYLVSFISGLTDMDAITLSSAKLAREGRLPVDTCWRMILVAGLSNMLFKGGAVAVLGDRRLLKRVAVVFGIAMAAGVAVLLLWPTVA